MKFRFLADFGNKPFSGTIFHFHSGEPTYREYDPESYTLHCTALHCTALHCTALHCTVLHCTVLYCNVLDCTVLHCTYCTVLIILIQKICLILNLFCL